MAVGLGMAVGSQLPTHCADTFKTGTVVGVVEVKDPAGRAPEICKETVSRLAERLSGTIATTAQIDDALSLVWDDRLSSLILLVPVGQAMYIVVRGKGAVFLKRDGRCAKLLEDTGSMSGEARQHDIFLVASERAAAAIPSQDIIAILDDKTPSDAAEAFADAWPERHAGPGCAAVICKVEELKAVKAEPEQQEQKPEAVSPARLPFRLQMPGFLKIRSSPLPWLRKTFRTTNARITAVVFVIFLISIGIGVATESRKRTDSATDKTVAEVSRIMEEGVALADLNPVKSRERLEAAKAMLEPLKETASDKTKEGRRVLELYDELSRNLTRARKAFDTEPELFYDASLLKGGAKISSMALDGSRIALLDGTAKTAFVLSLSPKNGAIVGGGDQLSGSSLVSIAGNTVYVLGDAGISAITVGDNKAKQVVKRSGDWGTISAMTVFGGNIYLLDTVKSRIWKYVATDKGFSEMREYLNPDTFPDLSDGISMQIDGHVWIGTNDGKLVRFSQGKEYTFMTNGIEPPLGKRIVPYASSDNRNIYILDADSHRVVVVDKDGMYISQYLWKSLNVTDIAVSEASSTIILLADGKLYGIRMQ